MTDQAPLYTEMADAPVGGEAFWLEPYGVRIRSAIWRSGDRGTVFIFTGRAEYIEKYGRLVSRLVERRFSVVTLDWRGQGLSERPLREPMKGHVEDFGDYQNDVAALIADPRVEDLPQPHILICHSMGGCIGTRSLLDERMTPAAVIMSAPMLGIMMTPAETVGSKALIWMSKLLHTSTAFTPGPKPRTPYVLKTEFADNTLTGDEGHYNWLRTHIKVRPKLGLGPPTVGWLAQAVIETKALAAEAHPTQPTLYLLGEDESIVLPQSIRNAASRAPNAKLVEIPGGRHEVLMETPERLTQIWAEIDAFLTAQGI